MNYYKRNIGDYAAATRHISILEHGVYTLLMDRYYSDERPLPTDPLEAARLIGARSKQELAAVEAILKDFFTLSETGWTQTRCDAEISAYQDKAERNRVIGKRGGRPNHVGYKNKPTNNPDGYFSEPKRITDGTLTTNHKPREDSERETLSAVLPPKDPRKAIWDIGVSLLGNDARSVIGQAIKRVGEPKVGEILGSMAAKPPAEPRGYFIKATQERGVVI